MKTEEKPRRIRERLGLTIPVQVRGRDGLGLNWTQMSRLMDVTPFGARLTLSRPTETGRLLHVTMTMPRSMRCFDHAEDQYRVWSLVRNVTALKLSEKTRAEKTPALIEAGVAFVGKHAPSSFAADPAQRYRIAGDRGATDLWTIREDADEVVTEVPETDKRRQTRHTIPVEVSIEVFGKEGEERISEKTVTENISRQGAAVFTSLNIGRGRFVRMTSEHYQVSALAAVRVRRLGPDGIPRLHLEFVGAEWPLEGIE